MTSSSQRLIEALQHRGVEILCPESVYIDPAIDPERISRENVVLHPGTRLRGANTLIGPGCVIGQEAPATLDDCALGKRVQFKGGYATKSAFLDDVQIGSGAQIREDCLIEEQASAAHTVGLKQTILMPYATVGSLVNFCDAMLGGGTGPSDHSEIGSGFIHFNFTPAGTKATASLFGDVPRGVFLREPRIFLGGQVGVVGPRKVGYGALVGAGSLLRDDLPDGQFAIALPEHEVRRPVSPAGRVKPVKVAEVAAKTIDYIAQLRTLRLWYKAVRSAYCGRFRLGALLNESVRQLLDDAVAERGKRLVQYANTIDVTDAGSRQFVAKVDDLIEAATKVELPVDKAVVEAIILPANHRAAAYLETMAILDDQTVAAGQTWLQNAVDTVKQAAFGTVPALDLAEA